MVTLSNRPEIVVDTWQQCEDGTRWHSSEVKAGIEVEHPDGTWTSRCYECGKALWAPDAEEDWAVPDTVIHEEPTFG